MAETSKRVLVAVGMLGIVCIAGVLEHFGIRAVRWLGVFVTVGMLYEMVSCLFNAKREVVSKHSWLFFLFLAWLIVLVAAAYFVGASVRNMLLLLVIICAADIGAWFFGKMFGGDKMWERVSEHKTWTGQIAGVVCGTIVALAFGPLVVGNYLPELLWIGIAVALLSQYGDLTASWIKRNLGIKDFGTILPGHGGLLDRFDGWIYVLPIVWMMM
ncbi:MAG: phosphatidate cytidylyltransferase [Proteobacteria bacterium]|nr:phosphatidate cytidylyltransferase [Candidatus Enterousia onthequi]